MRPTTRLLFAGLATAIVLLDAAPAAAIEAGQRDDFEGLTTMGWQEGPVSPNPPTVQANGGPDGAGDAFLRNVSSGAQSAGGRMVIFNQQFRWTGDWVEANVVRIDAWMANLGSTTLFMRLALQGFGNQFCSTTAVPLPPDGVWRQVSFELDPTEMARVVGFGTLEETLSDVEIVRIVSRQGSPGWTGDSIAGVLGVDDIEAVGPPSTAPPPVPDGSFGTPFLVSRGDAAGSTLELRWDVATCPGFRYHVLYGPLSGVAALTPAGAHCAPGTSGQFAWSGAPAGDLWLLLVARDASATEGSWGEASDGEPRGGGLPSGFCGVNDRDESGSCP